MDEEQRGVAPAIGVVIFNQLFNLRSEQSSEYVERVATLVDARMREVSRIVPSGDVIKIAVLAALNIADELCRLRQLSEELEARASAQDIERPPAPDETHEPTPEAVAGDSAAGGPPVWNYEDIFETAPAGKNSDQQQPRMTQQFSNRLRSRRQSGQQGGLTITPEGG